MLMKVYDYSLSIMPNYITQSGKVCFESLKIFINQMKNYESDIINEIIIKENQQKQREMNDKMHREKSKDQEEVFVDFSDPLNCFKQ